MSAPRAKVFEYEVEVDRHGAVSIPGGSTIAVPADWTPDHLLLAALGGKRVLLALTKADLVDAAHAPVTEDELLALIPGGVTRAQRVSSVKIGRAHV